MELRLILGSIAINAGMNPDGSLVEWPLTRPQPTSCDPYWDAGYGEFISDSCDKGDVTKLATWSVVPKVVYDPLDAALTSQGQGAFKTRASTSNHPDRIDLVKAVWKGKETTEEVRVCGTQATSPHGSYAFDIWSAFDDDPAKGSQS